MPNAKYHRVDCETIDEELRLWYCSMIINRVTSATWFRKRTMVEPNHPAMAISRVLRTCRGNLASCFACSPTSRPPRVQSNPQWTINLPPHSIEHITKMVSHSS